MAGWLALHPFFALCVAHTTGGKNERATKQTGAGNGTGVVPGVVPQRSDATMALIVCCCVGQATGAGRAERGRLSDAPCACRTSCKG